MLRFSWLTSLRWWRKDWENRGVRPRSDDEKEESRRCWVDVMYFFALNHHGLQQARLPCPSLSPGVCSNSRPLSRWCHPTISSSVAPFSSCPQSFPSSGSFPRSCLFASGGQSIGISASVLPMNIQDWFLLELTGMISLLSRDSQESSQEPQFKSINSSALSHLYDPTPRSIHHYWTIRNFVG